MLNKRQERFVDEYLIDLNATQAAVRAGYTVQSSAKAATRMLGRPEVRAAIDEALEKLHTVRVATAREVEEYLTRVMRGESESEIVVVEGTGEGCSEARRITKAPDEKERLRAAELMAKRHGLLESKLRIDGGVTVVLCDDV